MHCMLRCVSTYVLQRVLQYVLQCVFVPYSKSPFDVCVALGVVVCADVRVAACVAVCVGVTQQE